MVLQRRLAALIGWMVLQRVIDMDCFWLYAKKTTIFCCLSGKKSSSGFLFTVYIHVPVMEEYESEKCLEKGHPRLCRGHNTEIGLAHLLKLLSCHQSLLYFFSYKMEFFPSKTAPKI